MFTLNNPTEEERTYLAGWVNAGLAKYLCFQDERVSCEHLQGYVVFASNHRLSAVRGLLGRCHWEAARGTHEQCVEYSTKEESRVAGPYIFGEHGGQGGRSDLHGAAELLRDEGAMAAANAFPGTYIRYYRGLRAWVAAVRPGERRDVWCCAYIGAPGVGKTWRVYDECAWLKCGQPYRPVVTRDKIWFDGYDGEEAILFDDFVGGGSVSNLLQVCDRYPFRAEIKGGTVLARWSRVYFTSNLELKWWWNQQIAAVHIKALERRMSRVEIM